MTWDAPSDLDAACLDLCIALNALPGISTTGSCCGHGREPFLVWFTMDDNCSLGAITLARCLSGRYYCYAPGELRHDPEWRACIADTEGPVVFLLEGKVMKDGDGSHLPAELLAFNIRAHVDEDFRIARWVQAGSKGPIDETTEIG